MNETFKTIYERRSVRSYSEEGVDDSTINDIIKAGTSAPSAGNVQGLRFVVVTNRELMKRYSDRAKIIYIEVLQKETTSNKELSAQLMKAVSNPNFNIFYNAPVLVMVYTHPSVHKPVEDGSLAAENMMLAATSLGLGSCWIGFAQPLGSTKEFKEEIGMPSNHTLIAPLIFGHPKSGESRPGKKKDPQILNWIR
jgi:nitroreductase